MEMETEIEIEIDIKINKDRQRKRGRGRDPRTKEKRTSGRTRNRSDRCTLIPFFFFFHSFFLFFNLSTKVDQEMFYRLKSNISHPECCNCTNVHVKSSKYMSRVSFSLSLLSYLNSLSNTTGQALGIP